MVGTLNGGLQVTAYSSHPGAWDGTVKKEDHGSSGIAIKEKGKDTKEKNHQA